MSKFMSDLLTLTGSVTASSAALRVHPGDRLAFMGDSITASVRGGYLRVAGYVLATQYPELILPEFINAGIGGHKAEDMVARFVQDMRLGEKPEWIFINVGVNDVWHRMGQPHDPAVLDAYTVNVTRMVRLGQRAGARVVLLTPTVITEEPEDEANQRLLLYVKAMQQISTREECDLMDLHALFLNAFSRRARPFKLTIDGAHMAAAGDAIMAIGVLRTLGVPDNRIADTDVMPLLKVRDWQMTVREAASLLEVPESRLLKPELWDQLGF